LTALAKQEPGGLLVIEDLRSKRDLRSRFAEQEDIHSVAVCRLELRKKIVGMLYVNYRRSHWFSEMEMKTLRMLAGQAAVAIHNAHLLRQNEALATQRERNRLREDLHDVLNTFAFKVMEPAESIYEKEKNRPDSVFADEAEELWRFSRHTYQQLERILEDMRDPVLVERGLSEALRLLIEHSKLPGVVLAILGDVRPSADVELALYRICQEAISNIHKHARIPREGSNLCKIILELDASKSRLFVQDYGVGFTPAAKEDRKKRMGLQAMENWARKVSAHIDITSEPGKGTTLEVIVPNSYKGEDQHG
jgi:signal transduction histidine kinase